MKIPKNYDVCTKTPAANSGLDFFENPGIKASDSAVPMTPGEKATNDPACMETNRGQPFGPGGSGYTAKS